MKEIFTSNTTKQLNVFSFATPWPFHHVDCADIAGLAVFSSLPLWLSLSNWPLTVSVLRTGSERFA